MLLIVAERNSDRLINYVGNHGNFWVLRSYKNKDVFFLLFYVFFDVESEVSFGRSPLVFELWK